MGLRRLIPARRGLVIAYWLTTTMTALSLGGVGAVCALAYRALYQAPGGVECPDCIRRILFRRVLANGQELLEDEVGYEDFVALATVHQTGLIVATYHAGNTVVGRG